MEQEPDTGPHAIVRHLARVVGLGIETADMLVHEVLSRPMRDRKAVARYAMTGLAGTFRLIAWNAPGYMLSDNLRAETPSGRDYSDALDDFLKALGVVGFDVVANSFGTRNQS